MYREGKEDRSWKKEKGRSFKRRKNFIYMAVDISPSFTRDYTNGHDITQISFEYTNDLNELDDF
ncbi:hypothetical protein [Okeania sp. SIO1I7]|uniref:hypothetical protein n=1 Tax=Okeania sp. SIO1I7 TaxID=2607772 RepID=UPI0013FAEC7A|nr:hypothetical protein [Okeania sp. SIO1I7]NET25697.1 hypothetical protein [Okeania sp. SIO1I7]